MTWEVRQGDCLEVMAAMESESVDAVVCDPPYGLEFMGKEWDRLGDVRQRSDATFQEADDKEPFGRVRHGGSAAYRAPADVARKSQQWHQAWATQALRVLKPGGHLLAFGGTRTFHRLACALEDAGFEIRDCLSWLYGSGFPKSLDVSKAIDKAAGAREVVGPDPEQGRRNKATPRFNGNDYANGEEWQGATEVPLTAPATPEAQQWNGWGTALKPSWEPVVLARKPLTGTVSANVLAHGTGALNVDGCRVGTDTIQQHGRKAKDGGGWGEHWHNDLEAGKEWSGRWPANTLLSHSDECVRVGTRRVKNQGGEISGATAFGQGSGWNVHHNRTTPIKRGLETIEAWECVESCPVRMLDEQSGPNMHGAGAARDAIRQADSTGMFGMAGDGQRYGDLGGASRFFYVAKSSRAERNAGLEGFEERDAAERHAYSGLPDQRMEREQARNGSRNHHPTVKPIALMRWLCRLVTPPGGTILDPFAGSGTTGIAAVLEGFDFIGIEREPEYVAIARARIGFWDEHGEQALEQVQMQERAELERAEVAASGQGELF